MVPWQRRGGNKYGCYIVQYCRYFRYPGARRENHADEPEIARFFVAVYSGQWPFYDDGDDVKIILINGNYSRINVKYRRKLQKIGNDKRNARGEMLGGCAQRRSRDLL